jgi:hypothetical protein
VVGVGGESGPAHHASPAARVRVEFRPQERFPLSSTRGEEVSQLGLVAAGIQLGSAGSAAAASNAAASRRRTVAVEIGGGETRVQVGHLEVHRSLAQQVLTLLLPATKNR